MKTAYEIASERFKTDTSSSSNDTNDTSDTSNTNDSTTDIVKNDEEDNGIMDLHWYGHFYSYTGFSRMNRALVFELSQKNIKIKIDVEPSKIDINDATLRELKYLEKQKISPDAPKVFSATVPLRFLHNGPKILYTMIETESLHPSYVGKLNLFKEIWVPSRFSKNLFEKSGVHPPVKYVPLGVAKHYKKQDLEFNFGPLKNFRFLSLFRWSYRKGYDLLLKSYLTEFSSSDDVSLIIVSNPHEGKTKDDMLREFKEIRNTIRKSENELPHVVLYTDKISEKYMPNVYSSADAFVLFSRGEGFSLPLYEASACGLPVISTFCTAHKDILKEDNSYLLKPKRYVRASLMGEGSKMAKMCGFYDGQLFPDFDMESIEEAQELLRDVYEDYDTATKKGEILTKEVKAYTWENSANKIKELLKKWE